MPLLNWTPEHRAQFTRQNLLFNHGLDKSELFSDEALIALIDRYPRDRLEVFTMGYDPSNWQQWYLGRHSSEKCGDLDGRALIEGVKAGRLWLNLRKVNASDTAINALCEQMFDEIKTQSGTTTLKPDLGLLISSPNAHVFYHLDMPLVMLWQIRGVKKLYLYPPAEPCVDDRHLEGIALRESDEQLPYVPALDDQALIHDLRPGEMMTWVQNAPHRIVNHDMVNVSLSIEFMTPRALWRANLIYANGLLRRWLGLDPSLAHSPKFLEPLKIVFARLAKMAGGFKAGKHPLVLRFSLDANMPGKIRFDEGVDVPAKPERKKAAKAA